MGGDHAHEGTGPDRGRTWRDRRVTTDGQKKTSCFFEALDADLSPVPRQMGGGPRPRSTHPANGRTDRSKPNVWMDHTPPTVVDGEDERGEERIRPWMAPGPDWRARETRDPVFSPGRATDNTPFCFCGPIGKRGSDDYHAGYTFYSCTMKDTD
jgi:hypothetical protein